MEGNILIVKNVSEYTSFKKNGINEKSPERPPTPPALLFKQKEKILHIKWMVFFLVSHLLTIMLTLPSPKVVASEPLPVSKNFEILNLPVWNFSKIPNIGEKIKVSLFNEGTSLSLTGYFRNLQDDPLGPTGKKAELEISGRDIPKVRKAKGPWQIYPAMTLKEDTNKRSVYEVQF